MPSITIRDVPQDVRDELAARAQRSGRSLQEYLQRHLAELAARPDQAELLERIRARKRSNPVALPVETLLEARDADRR